MRGCGYPVWWALIYVQTHIHGEQLLFKLSASMALGSTTLLPTLCMLPYCCSAPSTLQSPASSGSSSVVLRDLYFGGKAVLPQPLAVSHASGGGSSSSGGCTTQLYRLGAAGGSKGAAVSGWVELGEGSEGGGSEGFGVGDMSSVVVAVGHYSPLAE
jgi:hypothetical protein